VEPGGVRALRVRRPLELVVISAREWVGDRFWFVPTLLLIFGVVWAALTAEADHLGVPNRFSNGAESAGRSAGVR